VRYIEKKLERSCPPDTLGTPDILLLHCEEVAVIDNLSGKLYLIVYADPAQPEAYSRAKRRLAPARAAALLGQRAAAQAHAQLPGRAPFAKADYLAAVERAKG
jgi:anthranilate synthase component 1